jgi:hypothetical protein
MPEAGSPGLLNEVGVSHNFPKIHPHGVDSADFFGFFSEFFWVSWVCANCLTGASSAHRY